MILAARRLSPDEYTVYLMIDVDGFIYLVLVFSFTSRRGRLCDLAGSLRLDNNTKLVIILKGTTTTTAKRVFDMIPRFFS